jgi:hypothetical protein
MRFAACLLCLAAACAATDEPFDDELDDSFLNDGKADGGGIAEGTPDAIGVLRVSNELTYAQLKADVRLDKRAAGNMVKHRDGVDAIAGTADDDHFDTLVELDAISYVGPVAFGKLLAYARAHGYVPAPMPPSGSSVETCSGWTHTGTVVCGNAHWDWEDPAPNGFDIKAATSFGANDVWTVGDAGSVLHFDGAWHVEQTPVCETLSAIWGTSATNLWAVGYSGRIVHRTAAGWTLVDAGTCESFNAVWGSPSGTIWITGWHDVLLRGNANGFVNVGQPMNAGLQSLYGFSDSDIWAAGSDGGIYHWDGATWTKTAGGHFDLTSIWASDSQHLFVAGFDWDKSSNAVWTFSPATAATPVQTMLNSNLLPHVLGSSANDVWATTGSGSTWHFDGVSWKYVGSGTYDDHNALAVSGSDVWAFGEMGARIHWNGTAWTNARGELHGQGGIWATSKSDVWIAKYNGVRHFNGTAWTDIAGVSGFFNGVWASSAADVYVVGAFNNVKHFDGTTWTAVTLPISANWYTVGGSGPSDLWIGGDAGKLVHYNGTAWSSVATAGKSIRGMFARSATDVWFATDGGLLHWDGTSLASGGPLNSGPIYRVWSSAPNDIWASGYSIFHYDGNLWTTLVQPAHAGTAFQALWGTSASDVWVAGGGVFGSATEILHWDGANWTTHVNALGQLPIGIETSGGDVRVIDAAGGIVRYRP